MRARRLFGTVVPAVVVSLSTLSCVGSFETPQAYDGERYLCGAENADAWAEAVATCQASWEADGGCGGVLSFEGQLEGTPLRVSALLDRTVFRLVDGGTSADLFMGIDSYGSSPYFRFALQLKSVGGPGGPAAAIDRVLTLTNSATVLPDDLNDSIAESSLRLTAGGESNDLAAVEDSGEMHIDLQGADQLRATFTVSYGAPADVVTGCMHLFATETRKEQL